MANRYIDSDDVDAVITAALRQALWDEAGTYDDAAFDRACEFASALVKSYAKNSGYSIAADTDGSVTTDDMVKLATVAVVVRIGYARQQQEVPEAVAGLFDEIPKGLQSGEIPMNDLTPTARDAVGGVKFTDTSTTSTDGKPPVFRDLDDSY